jgi:carbonic anhydrase/acetyltransferase-like protein (isoleucine patch superfamily)
MPIYAFGDRTPEIPTSAYVHPDAVIIGLVILGEHASVWPAAVLRGDFGAIRVGARSSIQDGTIIHATTDDDTVVGADCTVGHNVHLEGCLVSDGCLIGSMAVVLNGATIGAGSLVAAGAVVRPGTVVPPLSMAAGVPARIKEGVIEPGAFDHAVKKYLAAGSRYAQDLRRID